MEAKILYKESVFSKWVFFIILSIALPMVVLSVISIIKVAQNTTSKVWRAWAVLMPMISLVTILVSINFMNITIKITDKFVRANYGIFKYTAKFENIEECFKADVSAWKLGGYGVRLAKFDGRWTITYNKIGGEKVGIHLKNTKFKRFVISTNNVDKIIEMVNNQLKAIAEKNEL